MIGTGTMLDTARLRQILGRELAIDPRSMHAQVIGEHGDSEVCVWSQAMMGGTRIRGRPDWGRDREKAIESEVRKAAYEIIARKRATNHTIGLVTANLLRGMLRTKRRILTVSRVQDGAFGLEDVALSLPAVVGSEGASVVLEPRLDQVERDGLVRSADVLSEAIETVSGA